MINGFTQSVSGFLTAAPTLQVVFNQASNTFALFVESPTKIFTHLHNPRTVVITSLTVAALLVIKKLTSSTTPSDTVIDESSICHPATCAAEEEIFKSANHIIGSCKCFSFVPQAKQWRLSCI